MKIGTPTLSPIASYLCMDFAQVVLCFLCKGVHSAEKEETGRDMIISMSSRLCSEFSISISAPKHYIFHKFRSIPPKLLVRLENTV